MITAINGGLLGLLTEVMLRGELVRCALRRASCAGPRRAVPAALSPRRASNAAHSTRLALPCPALPLSCLVLQAADSEIMERVELLEPNALVRV